MCFFSTKLWWGKIAFVNPDLIRDHAVTSPCLEGKQDRLPQRRVLVNSALTPISAAPLLPPAVGRWGTDCTYVNAILERAAFRSPGRGMFWMRRQLNLGSHFATAQSRVVGWSKSLSKSWAMLTALTERRCSADWCGNRGEGRWNTWTSFPGRNSQYFHMHVFKAAI